MGLSLGDAALYMVGGAAKAYSKDVEDRKEAEREKKATIFRLKQQAEYEKNMTGWKTSHNRKTKNKEIHDTMLAAGPVGSDEYKYAGMVASGRISTGKEGIQMFLAMKDSWDGSQYESNDVEQSINYDSQSITNQTSVAQDTPTSSSSVGSMVGPVAKKEQAEWFGKIAPTKPRDIKAQSNTFVNQLRALVTPKAKPVKLERHTAEDGTVIWTNPYTSKEVRRDDSGNLKPKPDSMETITVGGKVYLKNFEKRTLEELKIADEEMKDVPFTTLTPAQKNVRAIRLSEAELVGQTNPEDIKRVQGDIDYYTKIKNNSTTNSDISKLHADLKNIELDLDALYKDPNSNPLKVKVVESQVTDIQNKITKVNSATTEVGAAEELNVENKKAIKVSMGNLQLQDGVLSAVDKARNRITDIDRTAGFGVATVFSALHSELRGIGSLVGIDVGEQGTLQVTDQMLIDQFGGRANIAKQLGISGRSAQATATATELAYLGAAILKSQGIARVTNQNIKDLKSLVDLKGSSEGIRAGLQSFVNLATATRQSEIEKMLFNSNVPPETRRDLKKYTVEYVAGIEKADPTSVEWLPEQNDYRVGVKGKPDTFISLKNFVGKQATNSGILMNSIIN